MTAAMRDDHAGTAPTGVVDWDNLSDWVSRLDSAQRWQLADALRDVQSSDNKDTMVRSVRDVLAQEEPDRKAVVVVFGTSEWENGYFVESSGPVLYADKSTEDVDFGDVDEVFTDEFGVCGPQFGLAVNLRTGDVDTDDYIGDLYDAYGYPFPGRR